MAKTIDYLQMTVEEQKTADEQALEAKKQVPAVVDRGYKEGYTDGSNNGIDEGRAEKGLEVARRMKEKGHPVSEIAKITGLPLSEIEHLG
jgi:predicted transposase/invertase (TIGR01784 family)